MSATVSVRLDQIGDIASQATVRTHTVLVDRSVAKGGLDRGPAGGEFVVVGLGGCFTSHLLAAIKARDVPMRDVQVHVTGTMDGVPERFTAFTIDVSAEGADELVARKMVTIAGRGCQVVNTLRRAAQVDIAYAGTPVELTEPAISDR